MMTPSPSRRCVPRSPLSLAIFVALLGFLTYGCRPAPKSDLQPGKAVVREIGGAEAHTYRLPLDKGTYLRMRIDQPGIDVTAKLVGPRGQEVGFFEEPNRLEEPDRLVWIAKSGGEYRLVIKPRTPQEARGSYRISLQELRPSKSNDSERLAAETDYQKARRLLANQVEPIQILRMLQDALRRWQKTGDWIGQVDALFQITQIQGVLGQYDQAISGAKQALRLAQEEHYLEGEARALSSLGDLYNQQNDTKKSRELFDESLPRWKVLGDTYRQGLALYSIGIGLQNDQPEKAFKYLEQARFLLSKAGDLVYQANVLTTEGWIEVGRGEYSKGLEQALSALELSKSAHDERAKAAALSLLGNIHQARGELEGALVEFQEACNINVAGGDSLHEGFNRQGLGSVFFNLGEPDRALVEYAKALQISRTIGRKDLERRVLVNTGYIYQNAKKDLGAALKYYRQALSASGGRLSEEALAFNNMGAVYSLLGKPEEALALLSKAFEIRDQIGERARQANTLLAMGNAYSALRDPRAEDNYRRALELSQRFGNTNLQTEILYRWAVLDRSRGRLKDALRRIRESLSIVESVRSQVISDKLKTSFLASKREYYELLVNLLAQLEEGSAGSYKDEALEASEWARARGLLDLLAEGHVRAEAPPGLQMRDTELRSRLSWLQEQIAKKRSEDLEAQVDQVQDAMVQLQTEIRKQDPHYAEVRYPTPLRAEQIRSLVDDRTALLHYFVGKEASFLFVVTRKELELYHLPGASALADQVSRLRTLIQVSGPRSLQRFRETATNLYSVLLRPATSALAGKSRLLIAPDGPLSLLPFEVLLTEGRGSSYKDLPYLLRRFAISYIPSASVFADLRKDRSPGNPEKSFLAFADPSYGGTSTILQRGSSAPGGSLAQLPESGMEVQRIAALYPGKSMLYLGSAATKRSVQQSPYLRTTPRVHFALHGTVDPLRPELSGLELADGRLQVFDIFNLKMSADLLTLSACQTALGKEVSGEGMIGLTRAFLYAGAHSIVVSLWSVEDRSTSDLMYDTYRRLGTGKAEALRQAKLNMISSKAYSAPYYWAPFILSGDPR
jgi:CHAT domain-containing protein/tetratricopeptide (TPR) repeat protein